MLKDNGCAKRHETRGTSEGECKEDVGKETEWIRALGNKIFAKLSECALVHEIEDISTSVVPVTT
ncbi:hypothetical protein PISMIDRAFT_689267 [Pisolithus microcarpus 441]|uniref:Uncharacterized protein n=1 Tax=Pisolithus microcarpus 441 TaxID=765257 RepID=A0A0C9YXN9_9AGAM|nr:hypothetical protein PISMIDRAFT_689267 [Pisolithus microcarpus 441]